ncbi:hypothetical protein ACFLXE_00165 [Chloroflexota bacterium]
METSFTYTSRGMYNDWSENTGTAELGAYNSQSHSSTDNPGKLLMCEIQGKFKMLGINVSLDGEEMCEANGLCTVWDIWKALGGKCGKLGPFHLVTFDEENDHYLLLVEVGKVNGGNWATSMSFVMKNTGGSACECIMYEWGEET